MTKSMKRVFRKPAGAALALSLTVSLSGCMGGMPTNGSLDSVHQPVVERTNYTLDVATGAGGLPYPEQRRLAGWFEALNLRYGDRISIDDPMASSAARRAVEDLAAGYGLLVGSDAPTTPGYVNPGMVRVVVTRASASVPGCPDWRDKSDANLHNGTSRNYGCATNSNLATMVADPEHLLKGATSPSETLVMSSDKAIGSYRAAKPTGEGGLKQTSSSGE